MEDSQNVDTNSSNLRKSLGYKALEVTTFHSSQCICDLGAKSHASLCNIVSCGICSAVKSSFTEFAFGVKKNEGRYVCFANLLLFTNVILNSVV